VTGKAGAMRDSILVTGFTGRLGGLVASSLRDRYGIRPRVLVRQAHLESEHWSSPRGMEVVAGDYDAPGSFDAALDGIDALFLVSPVHPQMRARELALAERAARQSPSPHVVKVSGLGTRLDSFIDSGRWHAEIERGIVEVGLSATFLRPLFFMQNLGFQAQSMRDAGVLRGGVEDAAIAMVDARDIAEVAAAVVRGGTAIEGDAVVLTGPRAYTYSEVAAAASEAFGRQVTYARQALDEIRATLMKSGQPDWHIEILLQFNEAFRRGWGDAVSDTVDRVLGRPPRTLEAYLRELAGGGAVAGADPFPST